MITISKPAATIWFESGLPVRLVWDDKRWQVLDTPTRLGSEHSAIYHPLVTHPPEPWSGWRFIARADDEGGSLVFDVKEVRAGAWEVVRVGN